LEAEMQLREWARENVIERILLRQAAQSDTQPIDEQTLAKAVAAAAHQSGRPNTPEAGELQCRIERLVAHRQTVKPPAEKEIAAWYKQNRAHVTQAEQIHVHHIVKNVEAEHDAGAMRNVLVEAEAELQQGVPFETVAERYSDCPQNGGDLGWFSRGQ